LTQAIILGGGAELEECNPLSYMIRPMHAYIFVISAWITPTFGGGVRSVG